jgi:hypothetical protein
MISFPLHSVHELFPYCTWYNIGYSYALDLYFDAFDAMVHSTQPQKKKKKKLTIGIDVLPMIGGQSKSIETTCLTNDMYGIVLIIEKNVANSRISFLWNNYNCSL